jgi:hypothetical protein
MNLCFKLRKRFFASGRHPTDVVEAHDRTPRPVHHALRMKNLLDEFYPSLIKDLMEVSSHQLLFD